jgi:NAD-dependent dihydropyrimidine dehydrogenase PreA subunit
MCIPEVAMQRSIIRIDESKCDGCGLCVKACHEGALAIIDGKARLVSETYCDGLGACLGECPQGAIIIEQRDAAAFDEAAVAERQKQLSTITAVPAPAKPHHGGGCPGSMARSLSPAAPAFQATGQPPPSQLNHWPIQLRLLNPAAPFLHGTDLLLCADCAPFAVPDFHTRYLQGRSVAVSCPKLDDLDEAIERLAAIILQARPRRITVLRMEVPCCGGLVMALAKARVLTAVEVPVEVHTIGIHGGIRCESLR